MRPPPPAQPGPPPFAVPEAELDSVLEAIRETYGYDFKDYARTHLRRRILRFLHRQGHTCLAGLRRALIEDRSLFAALLADVTVHTTELFRDPEFYPAFRGVAIPWLRQFSAFKIWHAGCSTGEEVYSVAILLREEGLLDRALIYATDLSPLAISLARTGIFRIQDMAAYSRNYLQAGGRASLAEYYSARYEGAVMDPGLARNVVFSTHNLATDASFGEMHLIICRNVLIYFNRALQDRVIRLFEESLHPGGLLCLGSHENIRAGSGASRFLVLDAKQKIFHRNA